MIAVLFAAAFQYQPFGLGDDGASAQESRSGAIDVQRVANNYTEPLQIYVSPVDGVSLVDPFVSLLETGESAGPASVSCASEWGEATELMVLARTLDDGDTVAERRVDLAPADCQPGGGAVFDVSVTRDGDVSIARSW